MLGILLCYTSKQTNHTTRRVSTTNTNKNKGKHDKCSGLGVCRRMICIQQFPKIDPEDRKVKITYARASHK